MISMVEHVKQYICGTSSNIASNYMCIAMPASSTSEKYLMSYSYFFGSLVTLVRVILYGKPMIKVIARYFISMSFHVLYRGNHA